MQLFEDIKRDFHTTVMGYRPIENLGDHISFTFKNTLEYGVAILNKKNIDIYEEFANVSIKSCVRNIQGYGEISLLELGTNLTTHRNEFAHICVQFVELGDRDSNRLSIQNNPFEWWERWQQLIGNAISNRSVASTVAELYAYYHVLKKGYKNTVWTGPKSSSHDIETDSVHFEVKSTTTKYQNEITISGQFQLESSLPLYLLFVKLEASSEGYSVNDILYMIEQLGYEIETLEDNLSKMGIPFASRKRTVKYRINELRCYKVDEDFPKITIETLGNDKFKEHIKKISYVIDLSGLDFENWI